MASPPLAKTHRDPALGDKKALPKVGEGSEEGSFIDGRCFGPSHAITIYAGGGSGGLGRADQAGNELCEVRTVTETSEVIGIVASVSGNNTRAEAAIRWLKRAVAARGTVLR